MKHQGELKVSKNQGMNVGMVILSAFLFAYPAQAQDWDKDGDAQKEYDRPRHSHHHRNFNHSKKTALLPSPPCFNSKVVDGHVYYYCDTVFYQKSSGGYVAIPPPRGAVVSKLPRECQTFIIEDKIYYKCDGSYYRASQIGYEIVPRPNTGRAGRSEF